MRLGVGVLGLGSASVMLIDPRRSEAAGVAFSGRCSLPRGMCRPDCERQFLTFILFYKDFVKEQITVSLN